MAKNSRTNSHGVGMAYLSPDEVTLLQTFNRSPRHRRCVTLLFELADSEHALFARLDGLNEEQVKRFLDALMREPLEKLSLVEFTKIFEDALDGTGNAVPDASAPLFCGSGKERAI